MNLRFIETFLWVTRLGSFAATASRLNTTQAAISHRIAALEEELGVELFNREGRTATLTLAGRQAIVHAEEVMRAVGVFRQAVSDPKRMSGTVRIGTNDVIVHTFLSRFMDEARKALPEISLELSVDTSPSLARQLVAEELDLILVLGQVIDAGVANVELGSFRSVWVAKPSLGLHDRPLRIADLAAQPIVTFPKESAPYHWLVQKFTEAGLGMPKVSNVNSLITILRLVMDGFGITAMPHAVVASQLAAGQLCMLDVEPAFPAFELFASYMDRRDRPLLPFLAGLCTNVANAYLQSPGLYGPIN